MFDVKIYVKSAIEVQIEDLLQVATIMGVAGACRCNELTFLDISQVQDKGSYFHNIHPNILRSFPRERNLR